MSHSYNDLSLCDDILAPYSLPLSGLSPRRKVFDLEDDLIEPFHNQVEE
jgi:hypothetical protein